MPKTILITGATDGIGFEAAKRLAHEGHTLLVHGRSATKMGAANDTTRTPHIDAQINNAGVLKAPQRSALFCRQLTPSQLNF